PILLSAIETSAVDFRCRLIERATGRVKEKFKPAARESRRRRNWRFFIHDGQFCRETCLNFWRASRFSHGRS
ncbi:hypothetical protein, partial [Sinorhizobium meliloti]|uniref:hypothetical protein n=1 Tax=Rhizobium meliloti TaxID=382 RepID=UPI001AECBF06